MRLHQVYKAVLRDTGQEVAVKVQRPNVEPLIFRDLYIFRQLVRCRCANPHNQSARPTHSLAVCRPDE